MDKFMSQLKNVTVALAVATMLTGCGSASPSFSILATGDSFKQNSEAINVKIDILWVIDTSGSMQEEQDQLAANFGSFISGFVSKNYDFRIAVTTTAAWRSLYPT